MRFLLLPLIALISIGFKSCSDTESVNNKDENEKILVTEQQSLPPLPDSVSFCGQLVAIDNFDLEERLDLELIVNSYYHSATIQIIKRANRYFPEIERVLEEEGMPDDLKYIAVIESSLKQAISRTGAKGFWQFMPAAGKEHGLEMSAQVDERFHIEKSTRAACDYFKNSMRKFDDWYLAAASYNCGIGGLNKEIERQESTNFFDLYLNKETSRYVFRLLALKIILQNPKAYGFDPEKLELYEGVDTKSYKVTSSIDDLAIWAKNKGSNLRMLKVLNPWLIGNSLPVGQKEYTIKLPK